MLRSFKDGFCARYRCRPEDYSEKAIAQCLYPHARTLWPVAELVGARTTFAARTLMEMAGQVSCEEDLKDVIAEYLEEVYPHVGLMGKGLKVRVSTKRLIGLCREVF
jgi:hypothetical protein